MAKILYTDGAAKGNPGPAGWAYLLDGKVVSGHLDHATNNQAELFAIYMGLKALDAHTEVLCVTDSKLAIGWLRWHWKTNKPYIADLVGAIHDTIVAMDLRVTYFWTRGHNGDQDNELVDRHAKSETFGAER